MSDSAPQRSAGELSGRVGRYEIRHQLGRGAMGVVYRAYDTVLERDVALKVMAAHMADDPDVYERFAREAKAVARMMHPNVVTVFDLGSHDDSPYIAMELLNGQDLAKALRAAPGLPLDEKLTVMLQVLAGLAHAHKTGIVHRDIKPANIFLSQDGTVKLMDFGIARLTTASLTGTGTVVGTADYMSPEQVMGEKVDGRSDLFSLGCVLFEMLTGQRPFHADELIAIFYRITHKDPDWALVTDAALGPIVRKALAKDFNERYQSAEEFAAGVRAAMARMALRPTAAVAAWPSAPTVIGSTAPTRRDDRATAPGGLEPTRVLAGGRNMRPLAYGAAALVLVAGAAAAFLLRPQPQPAPAASAAPLSLPAAGMGTTANPSAPPPSAVALAAPTPAPPAAVAVKEPSSRAPRPLPDTSAADAERRASDDAQRVVQMQKEQAAVQVAAVLTQAESDLSAQKYDAAIQGFDRALGIDAQNARALQGKSGAIAARAIAQAQAQAQAAATRPAAAPAGRGFVAARTTTHAAEVAQAMPEGFSETPGVTVKRGSQAAELPGRILFEVEPPAVAARTTYKVRIFLSNEGNAPIQVKDMVVGTVVNGRPSRAPVPPIAREVAPGQKALLREVAGLWREDTSAWSMEVLVRTQRGEAYQNRLTWQ